MRRLILAFLFCIGLFCPVHAQTQLVTSQLLLATPACIGQTNNYLSRTAGLSATTQGAIQTFVCGMMADGNGCSTWGTGPGFVFDIIYLLDNDNSNAALQNLCSGRFTATLISTPTFGAQAGFTGADASTTLAINTNFNPNTTANINFTQNSGHISVWSFTNATSTASGGTLTGLTTAGKSTRIIPKYSDSAMRGEVNSATQTDSVANANSTGWYTVVRTGSAASQYWRNASSLGTDTQTSGGLVNATFYILASSNASGTISAGSALQASFWSIGGALTQAQITAVYNRACTYHTTVHGSC